MKVRCIGNLGSNLPPALPDPTSNRDENTLFPLTIGRTYVVYGLTVYRSFLWYYLCDDEFTYFPIWNPSPLFEIVDHRVSKVLGSQLFSRWTRYDHHRGLSRMGTRSVLLRTPLRR